MTELDLGAILARNEATQTWAYRDAPAVPAVASQHFSYDVPALVSAVDRLANTPGRDATWVVARAGGRYCERCEGEIQRGHAYQEKPGTGGLLEHIHCPDQPLTREA